LKFEGAADQVCLRAAFTMFNHCTKTALRFANYFGQLNWRRPRVITELVTAPPRYYQQEITVPQRNGTGLTLKLKAAGPALYHMEMCKVSGGKAQRPRSGKLTPTKEPAS
jgi:hypothetical protein